jgi:pimeloyl-ACP methyl ester carboxylesterase
MRKTFSFVVLLLTAASGIGQTPSDAPQTQDGYVTTTDGVRLFYQKVGNGTPSVIVPARLFLYRDFQRLAKDRSLVFYDMRDRGLSDAVNDPNRITIQNDVDDLETIRQLFAIDKPNLIGFSYLGMMVMLYATQHPGHVGRIVQIGPVPRRFDSKYPAILTAQDTESIPDPTALKQLEEMEKSGYIREHPKEFCEKDWEITRVQLVGNPANVGKLGPGSCDMPNEWPAHLYPHFQASIASIQVLDLPKDRIASLSVPVLTIHGTRDGIAPYGSGREWAMTVRNGRLVTVPGAAHMSWVEAPDLVFLSIDAFLRGKWPDAAEKVTKLLENGVRGNVR